MIKVISNLGDRHSPQTTSGPCLLTKYPFTPAPSNCSLTLYHCEFYFHSHAKTCFAATWIFNNKSNQDTTVTGSACLEYKVQ